jgi:HTH-type transcriptional regulator, transcriptional repressor of NAD biosynthesis genes
MKIAVMGAECTGKTQLAKALAEALSAQCLPEVLREFCEQQQRLPKADEQVRIMRAQIKQEVACQTSFVVDCPPLMTAIYSAHYFGDQTLFEQALLHQRSYNLTLLCAPDLPWQADGLMRDGPATQKQIAARISEALAQHRIAYTLVSGRGEERLTQALLALRAHGIGV